MNTFEALQKRATEHFTQTGKGQIGQITNHHRIKRHGKSDLIMHRLQQQPCTKGANNIRDKNHQRCQSYHHPTKRIVDRSYGIENHLDVILIQRTKGKPNEKNAQSNKNHQLDNCFFKVRFGFRCQCLLHYNQLGCKNTKLLYAKR